MIRSFLVRIAVLLLPHLTFGYYCPNVGRWITRDPIEERGGLNIYAFCRNDPINNYDPNGCAYFSYRPIEHPLTQKMGVRGRFFDKQNWVVAHEQLYFEDGGAPVSVGYFKVNGKGETGLDEFYYLNHHEELPGKYDDCVMREAVKNVEPRPYSLFGIDSGQYNCQNYADDLRKEYFRLLSDRRIWCKCGMDKKGPHKK